MVNVIMYCNRYSLIKSFIFIFYFRSDKRTLCNESGKKNAKLPSSAVPPPIPMSPIVEKMEGLKAIRNRSNSLRLGRLAFYRHLEKVETMRCFWELKHVELEGRNQQVTCTAFIFLTVIDYTAPHWRLPENWTGSIYTSLIPGNRTFSLPSSCTFWQKS